MADEWDEWEEDNGEQDAAAPPAAGAQGDTVGSEAGTAAAWTWDLARMERDLRHLPPEISARSNPSEAADDDAAQLLEIVRVAQATAQLVARGRDAVQTLEALALVAKFHVLSLRRGFGVERAPGDADLQVPTLVARLRALAGDWGLWTHVRDEVPEEELRAIRETSALLRQALAACDGDVAPFQQLLLDVFVSRPTLTIPVAWIRPAVRSTQHAATDAAALYVQQLVRLGASDAMQQVAALTEAEAFQDAKDIARDELVVNGELIKGTRGYNAVVDAVQRQIEALLPQQIHKQQQLDAVTRAIAKQILHACNRTESGGSSFGVLSQLLALDGAAPAILRPDSASAAPLEITLDLGAFLERVFEPPELWAFGVRAVLSAVTRYVVCDADDPARELMAVETTYKSRMAFGLELTPFHAATRCDSGVVHVRVLETER